MKVLVDVNDNKADFILELLNNFPFAKAKSISPAKAKLLEEAEFADQSKEDILQGLQQAVKEMNLVTQGKLKARDAKDLLNEL